MVASCVVRKVVQPRKVSAKAWASGAAAGVTAVEGAVGSDPCQSEGPGRVRSAGGGEMMVVVVASTEASAFPFALSWAVLRVATEVGS